MSHTFCVCARVCVSVFLFVRVGSYFLSGVRLVITFSQVHVRVVQWIHLKSKSKLLVMRTFKKKKIVLKLIFLYNASKLFIFAKCESGTVKVVTIVLCSLCSSQVLTVFSNKRAFDDEEPVYFWVKFGESEVLTSWIQTHSMFVWSGWLWTLPLNQMRIVVVVLVVECSLSWRWLIMSRDSHFLLCFWVVWILVAPLHHNEKHRPCGFLRSGRLWSTSQLSTRLGGRWPICAVGQETHT